jgi:hydrogenase/urease accessory protein HupE
MNGNPRHGRDARALWAALFAVLCLLTSTCLAHNPDTSYVRVVVKPTVLEVRLSFDLDEMRRLVKLDADGDGAITREELLAQAAFMDRFIKKHFEVQIAYPLPNGATPTAYPVELGEALPPEWPADTPPRVTPKDYQATIVHFPYRIPLKERPYQVSLEVRFAEGFGNTHKSLASIDDGVKHENEIIFTPFDTTYDYVLEDEAPGSSGPHRSSPGAWSRIGQFLVAGMEHIFTGYDHISFLVALIVVSRFKPLLKIVTSFTVAHTIALMLAAFGVVQLPTRLIESSIALTIMYVAAENLFMARDGGGHRWMLTFFFGLIHGFGFANSLSDLELPREAFVRCLVSFNVGVELGQLVIVTALLPVAMFLTRWRHGRYAMMAISLVIFAFGAAWFTDRVFGLGLMPF